MTKVAKAQVSRVVERPRALLRAVVDRHHSVPLTEEDERRLASEYDRERGYDRPMHQRSKEAHEHAAGAPILNWTPPELRPRVS